MKPRHHLQGTQREHMQQHYRDTISLLHTAENSIGPRKKFIPTKKLQRKGKKKKRNGGKTYRVKEICKTSAKRNIYIMFKFQSQQTKKPKSSFLRQLKKWEQFLDFKDIKKLIIFVLNRCVKKVIWFYRWNNMMSRLYSKITVWAERGKWGYQENKKLGDGYMTIYYSFTVSKIFWNKKLKIEPTLKKILEISHLRKKYSGFS